MNHLNNFVGKAVLIRTAAYHCLCTIRAIGPDYFVVTDMVYIGDTGDMTVALRNGTLTHAEPWPRPDEEVILGRGLLGDMTLWHHPIPRATP